LPVDTRILKYDYDVKYFLKQSNTLHFRLAMPHICIEYSANLESHVDFPALMQALADSAIATGVFPVGGIRIRAYAATHCRIADGHPDNSFVHVLLKIGHGRDAPTRQRACQAIFTTVCEQCESIYQRLPLGISLEMQVIDPVLTFKRNNLHDYVKSRQAGEGANHG